MSPTFLHSSPGPASAVFLSTLHIKPLTNHHLRGAGRHRFILASFSACYALPDDKIPPQARAQ
ncbi:het-c2 protein [Moniliophthora roreri]|nr:het-c2 protein [Moniliophthora roreri]